MHPRMSSPPNAPLATSSVSSLAGNLTPLALLPTRNFRAQLLRELEGLGLDPEENDHWVSSTRGSGGTTLSLARKPHGRASLIQSRAPRPSSFLPLRFGSGRPRSQRRRGRGGRPPRGCWYPDEGNTSSPSRDPPLYRRGRNWASPAPWASHASTKPQNVSAWSSISRPGAPPEAVSCLKPPRAIRG